MHAQCLAGLGLQALTDANAEDICNLHSKVNGFSEDFAEEVVADAFVVVEVFGFGGYEVVWGEVAAVDFGVGVAFLHFTILMAAKM